MSAEPFPSALVTKASVARWSSGAGGQYRRAEFTPNADLMAIILAVEDDLFILQSLEWMIEDLGHTALLASSLAAALLHLEAPRHIDMLLVDIRLHALVFGGYEVADQAIVLRSGLPVLYTSGSILTDDMAGRFVPGGRFLQKPYSPVQLGSLLDELLK